MHRLKHLLKNYPLSSICIIAVWIVCLIPVPETPLKHTAFIDKWTHIGMYAILCLLIWVEYWKNLSEKERHFTLSTHVKNLLLCGWLAPMLMSGLIEIIQENCTGGNRSGEWLDFAANCTGATLTLCVGMLWVWCRAKQ